MNIVLIGYRGTGKTAVGKKLAKLLGWPLITLDDLIAQRAGRSIPEIVDTYGWDYFRDLETKVVKEVASVDHTILDTGGGVIVRKQNTALLKKNGLIFWLKADPDTIVKRIRHDQSRPSLTDGKSFTEEVAHVLQQRALLYQQAADAAIATGGKRIKRIAEEIIKIYTDTTTSKKR